MTGGVLVLDDSIIEKPYSERNTLVYQHWSGKQKEVVNGINLITLLWTDGGRCVPVDYRVFDIGISSKTSAVRTNTATFSDYSMLTSVGCSNSSGGTYGSGHITSNDGTGMLGGGGIINSTSSENVFSSIWNWLNGIK